MCDQPCIPATTILDHPLTRADLAVYAAIMELGRKAYREDIANRAKVSEWQVSQSVTKLDGIGLLNVERKRKRPRQKETKNFYSVPASKLGTANIDDPSKLATPNIDSQNGVNNASKLAAANPMNHESMNHDMDIQKEILILLDFIVGKNRQICAGRCSLEVAQQWRQVKEFYDAHELWESGLDVNRETSIGWIVRCIKQGDPPPPLQIPLPESSLDLSTGFKSRGRTIEDIQVEQGYDGGTVVFDDRGLPVVR